MTNERRESAEGESDRDSQSVLLENVAQKGGEHASISSGDLVIDLVTRDLLWVLRPVAPDLPSYFDEEGIDLLSRKQNQFLPVRIDDAVYRCVPIVDLNALHQEPPNEDLPAGRLARVPLWTEFDSQGGDST